MLGIHKKFLMSTLEGCSLWNKETVQNLRNATHQLKSYKVNDLLYLAPLFNINISGNGQALRPF